MLWMRVEAGGPLGVPTGGAAGNKNPTKGRRRDLLREGMSPNSWLMCSTLVCSWGRQVPLLWTLQGHASLAERGDGPHQGTRGWGRQVG